MMMTNRCSPPPNVFSAASAVPELSHLDWKFWFTSTWFAHISLIIWSGSHGEGSHKRRRKKKRRKKSTKLKMKSKSERLWRCREKLSIFLFNLNKLAIHRGDGETRNNFFFSSLLFFASSYSPRWAWSFFFLLLQLNFRHPDRSWWKLPLRTSKEFSQGETEKRREEEKRKNSNSRYAQLARHSYRDKRISTETARPKTRISSLLFFSFLFFHIQIGARRHAGFILTVTRRRGGSRSSMKRKKKVRK